MTQFSDIQDRISPFREDKRPREAQLAYQISCRRLAIETLALREQATFTVPAGATSTPIYDPTFQREAIYIFRANQQGPGSNGWRELRLYNQAEIVDLYQQITPMAGLMAAYTTVQGRFWPNRPPSADTLILADVAYKPVGDFDEVDFGPEFEDAIVNGALAHYMLLPGEGRDKEMAREFEVRFASEAGALRGAVLVGDAGYNRASTAPKRHHFGQHFRSNMLRY
jgi:hypothetical protein